MTEETLENRCAVAAVQAGLMERSVTHRPRRLCLACGGSRVTGRMGAIYVLRHAGGGTRLGHLIPCPWCCGGV